MVCFPKFFCGFKVYLSNTKKSEINCVFTSKILQQSTRFCQIGEATAVLKVFLAHFSFTVLLSYFFFQIDSADAKQMKSKKLEKEKKPPSEPTVDPTDKVST